VANVQLPIIGADFLANFSLLVDCRNNRLLEGDTSLSAPNQTASTRFPSVKTIGSSTSADDLFAELKTSRAALEFSEWCATTLCTT
jgi:hypothetical protein